MKTSILLVDDKPRMLKVIASALPSEQYELRFALNRKAALKEIQKKTPSFLLLDASSLSEDPWKLVHHVRAVLQQNQVKILFLVSHFFRLEEKKMTKYNIAGFIHKPFTSEELIEKLSSLEEKKEEGVSEEKEPEKEPEKEREKAASEESKAEDFVFDPLESNELEADEVNIEDPKVQIPSKQEIEAAKEVPPSHPDSRIEDLMAEQKEKEERENVYFIGKEDALEDDTWNSWIQEEVVPEKKIDKKPLSSKQKKKPKDKDSYFSIGDSNFSFSKDYIDRIGKHVETYEGSLASSNLEELDSRKSLSDEEKEAILREEVRRFCAEEIEKVAASMVPEIAERVVREKIEGVLDTIKKEDS